LATSYILICAIKKLGFDIVLCGRQAIDGDTAQVGPQLAEKLGIPQVTYVEELISLEKNTITAKRNVGNGWQEVKCKLPVLLTVIDEANDPRVSVAKKLMKCKKARTPVEIQIQMKQDNPHASDDELKQLVGAKVKQLEEKGLLIKQWNLDDLAADLQWCGRDGSPTKVHRIQSVVLTARESKSVEPSEQGITDMVHELINEKTIS
jgi:electron transfer flavoprotein beta subunit